MWIDILVSLCFTFPIVLLLGKIVMAIQAAVWKARIRDPYRYSLEELKALDELNASARPDLLEAGKTEEWMEHRNKYAKSQGYLVKNRDILADISMGLNRAMNSAGTKHEVQ